MSGFLTKRHIPATYVWVAAFVLWACFIWAHSLMPGDDSAAESGFFVALLKPLFDAFNVADMSLRSLIVRKFAHFSEHAVLGVLAIGVAKTAFAQKRFWWVSAVCMCLAVPCIDETIQLFVPGRAGAITDVGIDLCGCLTGALLASLIWWLVERRRA